MNTILSIANGYLQYQRGKQTGLAGLAGIGIGLLIVFQWGRILPVLRSIGIVDFLDRHGLIYEGEGYLTGFTIFMMAFKASILFMVFGAILIILAIIISMIFSSEIGFIILTPILLIITPFILIGMGVWKIVDPIINKKKYEQEAYYEELANSLKTPEELEAEKIKKAREKMPVLDLMKDTFQLIDGETAIHNLNRLPTTGDYHFLLAVTKDEEIYVVLPRARFWSKYPAIKIKVEKYDEQKHKPGFGEYVPKQYKITYDHGGRNKALENDLMDYYEKKIEVGEAAYFLKPASKDFDKFFKWITGTRGFKSYMTSQVEGYFTRKRVLQGMVSNAETKEVFEEKVELLKEMDVSNEHFVKIMWETQGQSKA